MAEMIAAATSPVESRTPAHAAPGGDEGASFRLADRGRDRKGSLQQARTWDDRA